MIKNKEYTGGNINGDISLHGYLTSVRDEGDTTQDGMIGVSNADGTDMLFMGMDDGTMSLYQKNAVNQGSIAWMNRSTGAIGSDYFALKSGDTFTHEVRIQNANYGLNLIQSTGTSSYPKFNLFLNGDKKVYMRIWKADGNIYDEVMTYNSETDAYTSNVFVLQTTQMIKTIQSLSPEELSQHKLDIQDKILELQLKLDKARENNFVESIELIEGQLEILNEKLSEIGVI